MKKGMKALELIFTLFMLIVVLLVVVRLFISRMKLTEVERPIQDITQVYNYEAAYSLCNSLCEKYESDCGNLQRAVDFCLQKVEIDIDGNGVTNEKYHYNVVEGIPLCEDGIYCFHIKSDCACGTVRLSPETCFKILCEFYTQVRGFDADTASAIIGNEVKYGSCEPNITKWKIEDYNPIRVDPYDSIWRGQEVTGIKFMGPDYWWVRAGYYKPNCSSVI